MELLILGTFWFWVIIIAGFITITYFVEKERGSGWGALVSVIVLWIVLYFMGAKQFLQGVMAYVMNNPLNVVFLALGYFFAGTAWSIVKWYFFLKSRYRKYETSSRINGQKYMPAAPKAKDHRSDILMWMSWWPFSALWTLVNDPFRKIFEWIFNTLEKTYDRISESIFKSATRDTE